MTSDPVPPNGNAPSIVVVDDASDVRLLMKTRLRATGKFDVVGEGSDGGQAVALAAQLQPSLMLLDVSMPGMDGLEALPEVLRTSPGTRVAMFSGFDEQGLADEARSLGAAAFLEKSVPLDELVNTLLALVDRPPVADDGSDRRVATAVDQSVLDEHLERFREVFESAAIGMATMTLAGRLVRVNRALESLMQRSAEELVGCPYGDLTAGKSDVVSATLDEIRESGLDVAQLEHALPRPDGDGWARVTLAPVRDSGGRPLYLFLQVQDITGEQAAREELRRSEERFRMLVDAVEDYAIFMLDPTGHVVSWNSGAQRSALYTAEDIIGQHFRVFYPPEVQERKHPEHELEVALRVGHYEEEGWRLRKDGSRFWASVLITAVHNAAGEHIGFAKVTRDISERRRLEQEREAAVAALAAANSELESLNARLQQAAEDQAEFLAVTAHELRTPIGVLAGAAETLSGYWDAITAEERGELFDAMTSSTTRLRRMLADLLTASRLQASALEMHIAPVEVAEVVASAITTVHATQGAVPVEYDGEPGLRVEADHDRLGQAVENLLANAVRHGKPPVQVHAIRKGPTVRIEVADRGSGVKPEMQGRLFDRFATGRRRGGTGLGLFIVRELARAQGGDAFYDMPSEVHPSGAFVITLPAAVGLDR